jgi:hypothetical protein
MAPKHKKRRLHIPRTPEQIDAVRQRIREQTEAYKRMKEEQRLMRLRVTPIRPR